MQCFVLLKRGVSPDAVNRSLADLPKKYYDKDEAKVYQFSMQTLSDIHFNSNLDGYISKQNLWVLSLIGIFLIITACVNFTNLATAQALGRTREIGVRKALGSMRGQIFWQFMTETILVVLLAIVLSIVLTCLSLPYVSRLFDLHFSIISIFNDPRVWGFLTLLLLIVTFISGAYPSVIVAGFQPVPALKGKIDESRMRGLSFRKGLVVVQFAISQLLIVSILVIARQMHYAQQEPGFDKEAVVMVALPNSEHSKRDLLTTKFSQIPGIETISFCNEAPVQSKNYFYTGIRFEGSSKDENSPVSFKAGDSQYASVFGLQLLEGRNLFPSDTVREFLLNETAVKKLGIDSYEDAIGKRVDIYGIGTIVGVVKDFHNLSFRQSIDPLCITTASDRYASCAIRINPHDLTSALRIVENVWQETFPDQTYHMTFLDEQVAHFYKTESILFNLIESFAGITIVIACLGLYGLVSFLVTQKTREVGVRKVLGASESCILWLFAKEFINLLIVAFAIAAPIAWWTMTKWLGTFVYRVDIGAWVFVLSIGVTFLLALISVGYQTLKAALANPVHSLRN
jgi:putative ABC transport system permease protein